MRMLSEKKVNIYFFNYKGKKYATKIKKYLVHRLKLPLQKKKKKDVNEKIFKNAFISLTSPCKSLRVTSVGF